MDIPVLQPEEAIAAMVAPRGRRNPYPFYEAIRAHGNLVRVREDMIATVGYAECAHALREPQLRVQDAKSHELVYPDWRSHSSLRGFTNSMLYTNPPDHARMRRLVTGAFTPRRLTALRPTIERMTEQLLDRMAQIGDDGAPVDLMAEFAFRLPVAVISEMLGVPENDAVWFRAVAADVMIALEGLTDVSELGLADAAMDRLSSYLADLIEQRRRHPADDLVSALVQVRDSDGDQLSEEELLGNLTLLLAAGFDTTTHLIGHGALHAFENPHFAARLRTETDFAVGYVEEALRIEPPVQATSRWAAADVDLMGMRVPAGSKVLILLAAGNRDPRRYPQPDRFDPERPERQPLSFAGGIHFCVGAPLARLEAQIALPRLLRRFPRIAVSGPPTYRDRWLARGHSRMPVVLK